MHFFPPEKKKRTKIIPIFVSNLLTPQRRGFRTAVFGKQRGIPRERNRKSKKICNYIDLIFFLPYAMLLIANMHGHKKL